MADGDRTSGERIAFYRQKRARRRWATPFEPASRTAPPTRHKVAGPSSCAVSTRPVAALLREAPFESTADAIPVRLVNAR